MILESNFPLWRDIIEKNNCGILVDPLKPAEIADAIDWVFNNSKEAEQMGKNGIRAVKEQYNWSIEEKKLFEFYK